MMIALLCQEMGRLPYLCCFRQPLLNLLCRRYLRFIEEETEWLNSLSQSTQLLSDRARIRIQVTLAAKAVPSHPLHTVSQRGTWEGSWLEMHHSKEYLIALPGITVNWS